MANVEKEKKTRKFNFDKFTRKMARYELNRIKEVANSYNRGELDITDEDRKKVIVLFQIVCESLGFTAQLKIEREDE